MHVRSILQTTNIESIIKVAGSTNISIFYYIYKKKFYGWGGLCYACCHSSFESYCDAALNEKSNETKKKYFIGIPSYNRMWRYCLCDCKMHSLRKMKQKKSNCVHTHACTHAGLLSPWQSFITYNVSVCILYVYLEGNTNIRIWNFTENRAC